MQARRERGPKDAVQASVVGLRLSRSTPEAVEKFSAAWLTTVVFFFFFVARRFLGTMLQAPAGGASRGLRLAAGNHRHDRGVGLKTRAVTWRIRVGLQGLLVGLGHI